MHTACTDQIKVISFSLSSSDLWELSNSSCLHFHKTCTRIFWTLVIPCAPEHRNVSFSLTLFWVPLLIHSAILIMSCESLAHSLCSYIVAHIKFLRHLGSILLTFINQCLLYNMLQINMCQTDHKFLCLCHTRNLHFCISNYCFCIHSISLS